MKKVLVTLIVTCCSLLLQAQSFTKADLQATGLTCAMCSNAINKALQELPFIASVKADIKNSSFHIVFKQEGQVDIDAIKNAVEEAGFSVGSLKVTGSFDAVKVANDQHVTIGKEVFHFINTTDQVLTGENTITVVDKNFVTAKQFKKISAATKMACITTGKAATCCKADGVPEGARVYHVTI
jgi:copper chaperone CopZ